MMFPTIHVKEGLFYDKNHNNILGENDKRENASCPINCVIPSNLGGSYGEHIKLSKKLEFGFV